MNLRFIIPAADMAGGRDFISTFDADELQQTQYINSENAVFDNT